VGENTLVSHYEPRHGIPVEMPIPSNRRRTVGVVVAASATLLIVAVIVVISLPGSGPAVGRAVATAPLQGAPLHNGRNVHTRGKSSPAGPATSAAVGSRSLGTTNPAAAAGPAINLAVPAGFGPLLRKAWVAADPGRSGLVAGDIASTLAGSVFYAEQPSAGIYWAISRFVPSPLLEQTASSRIGKVVLAQFGNVSVFDQAPGRSWHYVGGFVPGSCPTNIPSSVSAAWGLCSVGS
jgi:hypothetical protein